ncbi:MAG: CPBP family intramembrane metalloprotease [Theionarchaea archaeon]|nr:CPBP family intramembrane metalloprotease [Theionarchaea archaeon]MBU7037826.1 CPBP family intramembrane metalloprotease [Theionarchaea archaeon]
MKRIMGILFLVFLISPPLIVPAFESTQDYSFRLAWDGPPRTSSTTFFDDITDDGLQEIMYSEKDEDGTLFFTALDTYGTTLWRVPLEGSLLWYISKDIDDNGLREVFLITRMTSTSEERASGVGLRRIWCFDTDGVLLWTHDMTVDPMWDGTWFKRFSHGGFLDSDGDGYKECVIGNVFLDDDGTVLEVYGDEYSYSGGVYQDRDTEVLFIFVRETATSSLGEYTFCCSICHPDGTELWHKEVSEYTIPALLKAGDTTRLFLVQINKMTEIDLHTFEETVVPLRVEGRYIPALPEMESIDVDGDGKHEFVVTAGDVSDFGRAAVLVYDESLHLLWSYTGPNFSCEIKDLDGNGTCELCLSYCRHFSASGLNPSFFQVLDYGRSERWRILFDDCYDSPNFLDIDADGKIEIIMEMDFTPEEKEPRYLYIFGSEGEMEKQIKVPFGGSRDFEDLDGDGDLDIFYNVRNEGVYVYSNTRIQGLLDSISGGEPLEEVALGNRGFRRDNVPPISLYCEYQKIKEFFDYPLSAPLPYRRKMVIILSIPLILGLIFCYHLVRVLKKEESDWEPLWEFKKIIPYTLLLLVAPVGLLYFIYKIRRSTEELKNALGFMRIRRRQLVVSGAVGLIFGLITWGAIYLNAVSVDLGFRTESQRIVLSVAVLSLAVVASFVEEILFSGYLYPVVRKRMGSSRGIILTAAVFAVLNVQVVLIPLFFVQAMIKTYAYERTHCICIPMIIHVINNALILAGTILVLVT